VACRQVAMWRLVHGRDFTMAVNLSHRQMEDPGLVAKVRLALATSELAPSALVLEFKEQATIDEATDVVEVIRNLGAIGVQLSIDNFGAGMTSLAVLRRFNPDIVKIDRSLVANVSSDSDELAFLSAVVGIAHTLGIRLVAEGVETADQIPPLRSIGCDLAQGFRWKRPAPHSDISRWLDSLDANGMVVGNWATST
jgi:EAL domain-containing protein (putative c-di-GMP-specific phosphodiesterase class I)